MDKEINPLLISDRVFTKEDFRRLDENIALLNSRGMGKLNSEVGNVRKIRGLWNKIAEHNFAAQLCRYHPSLFISYEPQDPPVRRPIDFVMQKGGITFNIQMKDLSDLEWVNRRSKLLIRIRDEAMKIQIGKWFVITLSNNFDDNSFERLINFIKEKAQIDSDITHPYNDQGNRAELIFSLPSPELTALTYRGGMLASNVRNMTGEESGQILKALKKAAGAFLRPTDHNNINLIAMEADNKRDCFIFEALYETRSLWSVNDGWVRNDDGFFLSHRFAELSEKVAGVIALKRKKEPCEPCDFPIAEVKKVAESFNMATDEYLRLIQQEGSTKPICEYDAILYMNEKYGHLTGAIQTLLQFNEVVNRKMGQ